MIETVKLGDVAIVKGGKRLPKGTNLITPPNSHPYIRVRDLNNQSTLELNDDFEYVDDETQKSISRYIVEAGDIVLSIVGTIGLVAIIGESLHKANLTENCVKLTQLDGVDRDYLYYFLKSGLGQAEIAKGTVGAVQAKLPIKNIQNIDVILPDIETQKRISSILRSIDDKISTNQKINDNLQQQVAELYKSWYQDFSRSADLPLVQTEYGSIPRGWHYTLLGELCSSVSVTHKFGKEKLIFLNTGDVEDGRFLHADCMKVKDMPGQAKKTIAQDDVLFSEIRPINRHFAYVNFPADDYVVSTKLMVIRAKDFDTRRLYHFLTSADVLTELQMQAESRSGTFPQIRFDNVSRLPILLADSETETAFISFLHTVYAQIEHNNHENEKLIALRDTLLPKLMSGEIDVSNIQL